MKTYAFFNVKGGVGKTTTATTIAHILATEKKKKVLLIDLDPQSNTSSLFAPDKQNIINIIKTVFVDRDLNAIRCFDKTVGNLLIDTNENINDIIFHTEYNNLDLLPAFIDLAEIEEQMKADIRTPQQFRLKHHLEKVEQNYDYCILDCSPSINIININGLAVADYVFTPLKCDLWGISGYCIAQNLIDTVKCYNGKLSDAGCFFIQWQGNSNISKQIREVMCQVMGKRFIDIQIRKCVKVEEMTYEHKALTDYAPKSTAAQDYKKLTDYIVTNY